MHIIPSVCLLSACIPTYLSAYLSKPAFLSGCLPVGQVRLSARLLVGQVCLSARLLVGQVCLSDRLLVGQN